MKKIVEYIKEDAKRYADALTMTGYIFENEKWKSPKLNSIIQEAVDDFLYDKWCNIFNVTRKDIDGLITREDIITMVEDRIREKKNEKVFSIY